MERLNAEAAIDENIRNVKAKEEARKNTDEYLQLTLQERYDNERASKKGYRPPDVRLILRAALDFTDPPACFMQRP